MKIVLKVFMFCFLIFECSAIYSQNMNVGPAIWLTSNLHNESSFRGQFGLTQGLTFIYSGQDVFGVDAVETGKNQYEVIYKFMQNVPVQIYLALVQQDGITQEKLCQLNFFVDKKSAATASVTDLKPSIVHCQFSGNPNEDNFTLTMENTNQKGVINA